MKKLVFAMLFLLCFMTVPAFALGGTVAGTSISPHAEGVCAPNDMIIQAEEPEDTKPVAPAEPEPAEDEPAEAPEEDVQEDAEDEELTIEEMVRANRDLNSEVWYHMEDQDCPGHEWFDGVCLNCGCTEPVEDMAEAPEEIQEDEPHESGEPDFAGDEEKTDDETEVE